MLPFTICLHLKKYAFYQLLDGYFLSFKFISPPPPNHTQPRKNLDLYLSFNMVSSDHRPKVKFPVLVKEPSLPFYLFSA